MYYNEITLLSGEIILTEYQIKFIGTTAQGFNHLEEPFAVLVENILQINLTLKS